MGVTIKDIAEKTGLSITTISLVLNKKESRISEKTRHIIENMAQELHYSPNHAAISLATRKTNTLGLIIPKGSYYRPDDMLFPFEQACRNSGYNLSFSFAEGDEETCIEAIRSMLNRGVDGIVFDGSNVSEAFYGAYRELVLKSEIPIVSLSGSANNTDNNGGNLPNSILPDHQQGAYLAVSQLLDLGHSRIGCLLGPRDTPMTADFIRGSAEALKEFNRSPDSLPVFFSSYTAEAGHKELDAILKQDITGIFAGSDVIASGIFRRSYELSIPIPKQLSVIGYGNGSFAADLYIPLTTIGVHFDRIARKAVHLIKRLGQDEGAQGTEFIQPSLIVRASTARA
ncbi:LacI family transcriptional regulator [Spirochaetia bacterium]|nr:LacI family transcriptional regulator [Spirochaetia bacterium]